MSVIIDDLQKAKRIASTKGYKAVMKKIPSHFWRRVGPQFFNTYYKLRANITDNYKLNINGVIIDLDDSIFSDSMKTQIRMKKYEPDEISLIQLSLQKEYTVIDLGAGVGFTTSYIDTFTDETTDVIGVEANEKLIPSIRQTKKLNGNRFNIIHSAYNPEKETITFNISDDFWSSSQYRRENRIKEETTVSTVSIGELVTDLGTDDPLQLVVDIEGGEHNLIMDEMDLLSDHFAVIIIEFHSFTEKSVDFYIEKLNKNGFEFIASRNDVYAFYNTDRKDTQKPIVRF